MELPHRVCGRRLRVHKLGDDAIGSLLLGLHKDDGTLASVGVIGAFPMAERRRLFTELQPLITTFDAHPWNWQPTYAQLEHPLTFSLGDIAPGLGPGNGPMRSPVTTSKRMCTFSIDAACVVFCMCRRCCGAARDLHVSPTASVRFHWRRQPSVGVADIDNGGPKVGAGSGLSCRRPAW
jgi:hypothetical protein